MEDLVCLKEDVYKRQLKKFVAESLLMNSGMFWPVATQAASPSSLPVASGTGQSRGRMLLVWGVGALRKRTAQGLSIRVSTALGIGPKARHNMAANTDALRRPPAAPAPGASRRLPLRCT